MNEAFYERILELIKSDLELHSAVLAWLKAKTESELALAEYRRRHK